MISAYLAKRGARYNGVQGLIYNFGLLINNNNKKRDWEKGGGVLPGHLLILLLTGKVFEITLLNCKYNLKF